MRRLLISIASLMICLLIHFRSQAENSKIDSLLALVSQSEGQELTDIYLRLAKEYIYVTPVKTIEYAERALSRVEESEQEEICYANLLIGSGYIYTGQFQKGEKYITKGLALAREIENDKYISLGLGSLAAYHMNTGNYDKALELLKKTLQKAKDAGLKDAEARAKFNIGSILTNLGDRAGGLRYMTEALNHFESTNNVTIVSRILNNIAVNYHAWKDYDLALRYYRKTLRNYERNGDILGKVVVLNNIGEIYKDKGQYEMALAYYNQIFDLAKTNDVSEFYQAVGWVGLAETYLRTGEIDLAKKYAEQARRIFQQAQMQEGIINANLILSEVNLNEGNLRQAKQLIDPCITQSEQIGLKELYQKACLLNSRILDKQGRHKQALESYKRYVAITDTLNLEKQLHQLALHRAELDISEKENEIELLQKDNEIKDLQLIKQKTQSRTLIIVVALLMVVIALSLSYNKVRKRTNELLQEKNRQILQQHEELIQVNQTKDKFLSIIGHDLRNPIGAFKDVVSQLAEFPEMFTEELRKQILDELRDEAESTYFLLDNLLLWAKTQKNSMQYKPERLRLNLVVKNNVILNKRIAERKEIELKSSIPDNVVVYADHNMVDLIIRNLLSNAIKFTPQKGKVKLTVSDKDDQFYEISVRDTGVGIAKEDIPRLFDGNDHHSTYGTGKEKGSGLGLILCKEFVEANGGTIEVQSKVNKGSTFFFTLKKYKPQQS